ncbi:MAG: DUF6159 family protein [Actinomycetes bacterium]
MATNKNPNAKQLLTASLALFRQDKSIAALPVLSVASAFATLVIIGGGLGGLLTIAGISSQVSFIASIALALLITMFLSTFFGVAVVFAAADRIEGGDPTVKSCMAKAWQRKGIIFGWALLSAVVGTILNAIQEKVPFGELLSILGGLAWAVATWFVLPVIAFEDVSPFAAVKRSAELFKQRWGKVTRSAVRFGILFFGWMLLGVVALVGGLFLGLGTHHNSALTVVGLIVAAAGLLVVVVVSVYLSVVQMYLRTILYRFAVGKSVPDLGVDLAAAFPAAPLR